MKNKEIIYLDYAANTPVDKEVLMNQLLNILGILILHIN